MRIFRTLGEGVIASNCVAYRGANLRLYFRTDRHNIAVRRIGRGDRRVRDNGTRVFVTRVPYGRVEILPDKTNLAIENLSSMIRNEWWNLPFEAPVDWAIALSVVAARLVSIADMNDGLPIFRGRDYGSNTFGTLASFSVATQIALGRYLRSV